jgi:putative ATP-binding cassette transporter
MFFQWLKSHRSFRIASLGEIGVNPDQRIHADAQRLAEVSTDLGVGLLQATLLLLSFVGVLWGLSEGVAFGLFDRTIVIPGYMVWCALLYASVASFASRVNRWSARRHPALIRNAFCAMKVNEHGEAIAFPAARLEEDRLHRELDRLRCTLNCSATTNLTATAAAAGSPSLRPSSSHPRLFCRKSHPGGLLMAGGFHQAATLRVCRQCRNDRRRARRRTVSGPASLDRSQRLDARAHI